MPDECGKTRTEPIYGEGGKHKYDRTHWCYQPSGHTGPHICDAVGCGFEWENENEASAEAAQPSARSGGESGPPKASAEKEKE